MAKRLVRLAAGIWLCSGVPGLWGQSQRAIILGRSVDSSGGIVPGAEIRVIQKSTGFVRNALTDVNECSLGGILPCKQKVARKATFDSGSANLFRVTAQTDNRAVRFL